MSRIDRTQECGPENARTRRRHAELYLEVAQMVLEEQHEVAATVAAGNAVLASIAAADAICCAAAGSRYRGRDHRRAAEHLETVTGDPRLAALLREVMDLKDVGHYGLDNVQMSRAKSAVRRAGELVAVARRRAP